MCVSRVCCVYQLRPTRTVSAMFDTVNSMPEAHIIIASRENRGIGTAFFFQIRIVYFSFNMVKYITNYIGL